MEQAVLLSDSDIIHPHSLNPKSANQPAGFARTLCNLKENDEIHTAFVLTQTGGDRKQTARILGVSVRQIQRKLNQMKENPRLKPLIAEFL